MRVSFKLFRQNSGATAIEFAIVAPVLFLLLFGIIEFSLMMFASSVIEGATAHVSRMSKTGANRSTATDPTIQAAEDAARLRQMILKRGSGVIRDNENLVVVTQPKASQGNTVGRAGEKVVYNVSYDWDIMTPFLGTILGDEEGIFHISSMTVVVNEPFEEE